jgi:hypothetical protein
MKKRYIIGAILSALCFLVVGGVIGFIMGSYSGMESQIETTERQKDMQLRTEEYKPTCEQLKSVGKPQLIKNNQDYFVVDTSEDYFVVFGFNAEPGQVPVTSWWGAGRREFMEQACNRQK